jgi:pimeloyl-ACP methyl ester carboxylesterase
MRVWFLSLLLLLAGCASRPDLVRLYENASDDPNQPPVIVLHGLAGSTLVDARTGKQFWPGGISSLAFGNYRHLAQMSSEDREGEGLVPGELTYGVVGVDFYADLLKALETVGRFERGVPGRSVGADRRRYYVFLYDWRKDNVGSVRKLHALIEQIRADYRDPALKVDLIAHSNGGVIANYYLRYGPADVLDAPAPTPWTEGGARIRRLVMLGTPTLGAVTSLERLVYGLRIGLGTVPVEVMATFATPYQALPHPLVKPILDTRGRPLAIDIYDPAVWRRERWGVFSPEVVARVRESLPTPALGDQAVAELHGIFERNLRRAERLQWALTAPLPPTTVETAVFGGDCEATPGHAVLMRNDQDTRLVFRPSQVDPDWTTPDGVIPKPGNTRATSGRTAARQRERAPPALDYARLMSEPGDGLITRSSQVARRPIDVAADDPRFHPLPAGQTFFLCESHGRLTHNPYFQNNLLYFLLAR